MCVNSVVGRISRISEHIVQYVDINYADKKIFISIFFRVVINNYGDGVANLWVFCYIKTGSGDFLSMLIL
jgi:hypothetical protein